VDFDPDTASRLYPGLGIDKAVLHNPGDGVMVGSRAGLKNVIRRLRKKIEPDPAIPVYLLTGPGHGYRFRDR
jgi:DNA-binding response OmpR family regulator